VRCASVLAIVAGLVAGCGTVKNLASNVKTAKIECERCQAVAVGVGTTFNLRIDWDRCNERDPDCDASKPPFTITASCDGITCKIEDTGGGYLTVTPTSAGLATVVVTLKDQRERTERIGPFTAAVADAIAIHCTYIAAGGGMNDATACDAGIPPHSDVYLELMARAGDKPLAAPMPDNVAVDGHPVYKDGQVIGGAAWVCAPSTITSDPAVPSVTRCHLVDAPAGAHWTIDAAVPALKLGARAMIAVGKAGKR
jgi:hypothetical protein